MGKDANINVLLLLLSLLSVPHLKGNYKSGDKYEDRQLIKWSIQRKNKQKQQNHLVT